MKVLQVHEGGITALVEVPVPDPGPGQVRMRVEAVTTCPQWDLHLRHGEPMFPGHRLTYPYTAGQPGHEATGTIDQVGAGVQSLREGDRVSIWRDPGHHVLGAYAQYVVRDAHELIRVPSSLPPEATAPVELGMCLGATFQMLASMDVLRDRTVAVFGLGPAGLIAVQMAKCEGAAMIFGFDVREDRRALALTLGAQVCASPADAEALAPLRPDALIDTAIDCVGAKATVEWLMDRTRDTVALFGVQREPYTFDVHHYSGLRLCGYPGHSRSAAEYAVAMMERGELNLGSLVTHRMALEQYDEAVDLLERQVAVKVSLDPWARSD